MSDTQEMRIKLKATKWQVVGRIAIALIGLYAATLATTTATSSASKDTLEAMVEQLNRSVIPAIQKLLEEMRYDAKQDRDDAAALRERVARLEGILESMPGRRGTAKTGAGSWVGKVLKPRTPDRKIQLPTLQMQHQQMGPSLEGAIKSESGD